MNSSKTYGSVVNCETSYVIRSYKLGLFPELSNQQLSIIGLLIHWYSNYKHSYLWTILLKLYVTMVTYGSSEKKVLNRNHFQVSQTNWMPFVFLMCDVIFSNLGSQSSQSHCRHHLNDVIINVWSFNEH